jgi:hypothetical protein
MFWVYLGVTVVLTLMVVASWRIWLFYKTDKDKRADRVKKPERNSEKGQFINGHNAV